MRSLLILAALLFACSIHLSGQNDFKILDEKTYEYYIKGDYKNLVKTSEKLLSRGIDYYYLRMRLGILSYNEQLYSSASKNFDKAIEFSSLDTISREYIYYSYLFSGRDADANLYLGSIPYNKKNNALKSIRKPGLSEIYTGSSGSVYDVTLYRRNNSYYEAVKNSLSFITGFESYFFRRFKGTFAYSNYQKTGTVYSASQMSGKNFTYTQNQVYARLTGYIFPGWEFSAFSHLAVYNENLTGLKNTLNYLGGVGISKNGWKLRTGMNMSLSNFSNSMQIRGEGLIIWLPFGNLNLYLTSGGMYQSDINWGPTYQINQEAGCKISQRLWLESGIVIGNSFLYSRNEGYTMNNSFLIPATTVYANLVLLPVKHFRLIVTPYYAQNQAYSWDINAYTRNNKLNINSFGGTIKIIYKIR